MAVDPKALEELDLASRAIERARALLAGEGNSVAAGAGPFAPSYPSCAHCGRSVKKQRNQALDEAAAIFMVKMEVHARQALWMGPQRQRYEGARISGVEMSPMNGPAISFDAAMQNFLEIRALRSLTED